MKYIIQGTLTDIEIEESGHALVAHTHDLEVLGDTDGKFFVRLHSYQNGFQESADDDTISDEEVTHPIMESIRGQRIRITVETLDGEDEVSDT